jgi:heat shock protein HslJ
MTVARLTVAFLALLAAGCGAAAPPGGGQTTPLRGHTFLSTKVTENGQPHDLATNTRVTFRFMDDGRLLADAGCNTMAGPVTVDGARLEVSDLSTTQMGCDPARHEQDEWLATFLAGKPSWKLDGDTLVVTSESKELTMRDREVAEPDLPLRGTRWTVESLIDGQTASSVPQGTSAWLTFGPKSVELHPGCNQGSADYELAGDTIRFGPVLTTRMACEPEAMALEQAVLAVLDGTVTYEIDSNTLTLHHPSGKALQLRA